MNSSRLTNHTHNDLLNNTLPTLSPRLFSFAEPNSRNTSLHIYNNPSQSPSSINIFLKDFQLMQNPLQAQKTTMGHIAMINGNDKKQVKQALEEQSIERNIKNRMSKYLNVLQKVSKWESQEPFLQNEKQGVEKNLKNSIIMEIAATSPDAKKYLTEPSLQNPHYRFTSSPFRGSSSRYQSSQQNKIIAQNSRIVREEGHKKSASKQKSASSRASHSKVFKKIEIKSANLVSQHASSQNKNRKSPHEKQGRKIVSPSPKSSSNHKNTLEERTKVGGKTQLGKDKTTAMVKKHKYQISRREEPKKGDKKRVDNNRDKSISNRSESKSKSISTSRVSLMKNTDKISERGRESRIIDTRNKNKISKQDPKKRASFVADRSDSKSSLHRSRLKQQVKKLEKDEMKEEQKANQLTSHRSNNHLLNETMEKTCMFLDMLRMMEN